MVTTVTDVFAYIETNINEWDQNYWVRCFAGMAVRLIDPERDFSLGNGWVYPVKPGDFGPTSESGGISTVHVEDLAPQLLYLREADKEKLFYFEVTTIEELYEAVKEVQKVHDRLWRVAYYTAYVGALNPDGVRNAIKTWCDEGFDFSHPAIRAMAGHLDHLNGNGLGPEMEDLNLVVAYAERLGIHG